MLIRGLAFVLLLSGVASAQTRPEFDVASIRPSADQPNQVNVGVRITGTQMRIAFFSLKDYLGLAYRLKPHQITGPDWLGRLRFDIAANIPDGATTAQVPEMVEALLVDRFQLKSHRETKESPVYALGVATDGLKIQPSPATADAADDKPAAAVDVAATGNGNGVAIDLGSGSSFTLGNNQIRIKRMTMASVADVLTRFMDRPVVDFTGVTGVYDLTLDLTAEDYTAMLIRTAIAQGVNLPPQALRMIEGSSNDPLSAPLRKAGLTLDARRAPLEFLVVDSMLMAPTAN